MLGDRPGGVHVDVVTLTAAGGQQREVVSAAFDPVLGVLPAPGPEVATGRDQFDANVIARILLAAHGERVAAGPYTDVADVLAPVVLGVRVAKPFGDVMTVSPRLHEPRGRHR